MTTQYFRNKMEEAGFDLIPGTHPIVPIMICDDLVASCFADDLLQEGLYAVAFSFPVVPKGTARIRTQLSAAHTKEDLDKAVNSFIKVGKKHRII